jgi:hypothetical protein
LTHPCPPPSPVPFSVLSQFQCSLPHSIRKYAIYSVDTL